MHVLVFKIHAILVSSFRHSSLNFVRYRLHMRAIMAEAANSLFGEYVTFVTAWMMMSIVGYQFTYLNPTLPALQIVFNETYMERYGVPMSDETWLSLLTISTTAVIIGAFIGTLISKPLIDLMSRKRMMQVCHITQLVGVVVVSLIGGLTKSYEAFIIGRVIIGLPCGVVFNIAPVMVGELCAKSRQGFWQSIPTCSMNFGIVVAVIFGHPKVFGSVELWPVVSSLSAVPSLIYLISSLFIPNTPYYLLRNNTNDETLAALKALRVGSEESIRQEMNEITEQIKSENVVTLRQILIRKYRRMFLLVVAIHANLMLVGVNGIAFYSDILFIMSGISAQYVTYISIGIFAISFSCAIAGLFVVKFVGYKRLLIISNLGSILAIGIYTLSRAIAHLAPTAMQYVTVASVALFMIMWAGGIGVGGFGVVGFITTESTRPSTLAFGSSMLFFTSWLTGFLIPYLLDGLGSYAMILWAAITLLMTIYFQISIPELSGKTENQIQAELQGNKFSPSRKSESEDDML